MENVIGSKYGRYTILKFTHIGKNYNKFYLCKCDCGTVKTVRFTKLKYGEVISCGCFAKERLLESNRLRRMPFKNRAENMLYSYFKGEAQRKNTPFRLTKKECSVLAAKACFYCGCPPSNLIRIPYAEDKKLPVKSKFFKYHGIDRVKGPKGYVKKNVVPCCKNCNLAKRTLSQRAFFKMVKLIYEKHL